MTDFRAAGPRAVNQVAVDDDASAEAGPDRHHDEVIDALTASAPGLAEGGGVAVVVGDHDEVGEMGGEGGAQVVGDRHPRPAGQVGRAVEDLAGDGVDVTRRAHADADQAFALMELEGGDRLLGGRGQGLHDGIPSALRGRREAPGPKDRARFIDQAGENLGSAEVESQGEARRAIGARHGGESPARNGRR
ncbi:hypothetical protein D3C87_1332410 [compost metagenome]